MARPVTPLGIAAAMLRDLVADAEASTLSSSSDFLGRLKHASELIGGLESYVDQRTSHASERLQRLADRTSKHDWQKSFHIGETSIELEQEMLSGHAEGEFLKMLVAATKAQSILEIGMFTGYGTLAMAEQLPEDGRIIALEYDAFVANFAMESFQQSGIAEKIDVRVGPAAESLQSLIAEGKRFDFVFLDADKSGYRDYLETLLASKLLTDDALICVDNTLLQGEPYCKTKAASASGMAIADFNDFVSMRPDLHHVLIPIRDGVTLIRRHDTPADAR
ncbi:MAG: class I SAM-dependent methyltransferase [Planctomycetota bacterium]